jgi:hypothetical protein
MQNAQKEEFKHFGMDLEFLLRRKPQWRKILQEILSKRATSSSTASRPKKTPDGVVQVVALCFATHRDEKRRYVVVMQATKYQLLSPASYH